MASPKNNAANISEKYYQISSEIYTSFPKYRPPVDLYIFNESIATVYPFAKKGQRLNNAQIEKALELVTDGLLFVPRSDISVLAEHLIEQLDLVLLDTGFKTSETARIIISALAVRYNALFVQPVVPIYEKLYSDFMVFSQYIFEDKHRLRSFLPQLFTEDYNSGHHAVNSLILGAWIFTNTQEGYNRKMFDRVLLGLYLHDIGFSKVPGYIINKSGNLKTEEIDKIKQHALEGAKILRKFEIADATTMQAVLEHHERLDGSGYPQKTKEISIPGKITAIVDSLSAMIQHTPHRPRKDISTALQELFVQSQEGKYDSKMIQSLLNAAKLGALNV